jgi:formylmethanofuran dehydrogenase subunit E
MGTFTKLLDEYLREQTRRSEENLRQLHQKEAELQKTISQLKITSQEKADLQRQITNLKPIQLPEVNWPKINVSGSILEFPSVSLHLFICSNCGKSFAPRNLAGATSRPLCEDCALQRILTIKPIV